MHVTRPCPTATNGHISTCFQNRHTIVLNHKMCFVLPNLDTEGSFMADRARDIAEGTRVRVAPYAQAQVRVTMTVLGACSASCFFCCSSSSVIQN